MSSICGVQSKYPCLRAEGTKHFCAIQNPEHKGAHICVCSAFFTE